MSRWAQVLTFAIGFLFAFAATAIIGTLGASYQTLPVWCLLMLVGIWIWQLPNLKPLDPKLSLVALYSLTFLGLWLVSNPAPSGIKLTIYHVVVGLLLVSIIAAALTCFAAYQKRPPLRPIIGSLLALFACCWLVAFFSSSTGAGKHMLGFASFFGLSKAAAELLVLVVRKSLHFLFYGSLGFLAFKTAVRGGAARVVELALVFTLFHASFDEIRQSGFPDRTGSFWDVCLDMCGAAAFVFGASVLSRRQAGGGTEG